MKTKSSIIQKLLVLYVTLWTISPPLQLDSIYRFLALGAIGLWFILNIPHNVEYQRIHVAALLFVLFVALVALIEYKGQLSEIFKPINYYLLIVAFLMAYSYKDRWDELSDIIPIVLLFLAYFNYQTYKVVLDDPAVARLIVRNDPSTYSYIRSGVGGYGLLYSQVCIFPMLVAWILSAFKKSKIRFAIGVVWLVTYVLYLLNSGYTIATVASVAGLIILFLYRRSSLVLAIVVISVLVVSLVWLIGYNDGFRNALLSFFDGTTVAKKINDIYLSITTNDTADSIMARIEAYQASFETILTYPLIGGLWFPGGSGGGHSALIDSFAKYGLFGGYIFCKIIFYLPMSIKRSPLTGKDVRLANATFIVILMITLLNSLPYNFVMLIVMVIPVCYNDILKWRNTDENSLDSESHSVRSLKEAQH